MACESNLTDLEINSVYRENLNLGYGSVQDNCGDFWTKIDPNSPIGVINVKSYPYGAIGDGGSHPLSDFYASLALAQVFYPSAVSLTDEIDTVAIQKAITAANGQTVYCPLGGYRINQQLVYNADLAIGQITIGFRFCGDGAKQTIFQNGVANAAMLLVKTTGDSKYALNSQLWDFQIIPQGVPANSDGIELRRAWVTDIRNIYIKELTGHGIHVICANGDLDAPLFTRIENAWVVDNKKWGIYFEVGDTFAELSWTQIKSIYVARCGTAGVADTGGIKWRGTILNIEDSAITQCENFGFNNYSPATGGTGSHLNLTRIDFEHNKAIQAYFSSAINLLIDNCEILVSTAQAPAATKGFQLDGSTAIKTVQNATIIRTKVRVDVAGFTAFDIGLGNVLTVNIEDTAWTQFDVATGQVRFANAGCQQFHVIDSGIPYPRSDSFINAVLADFDFTADPATDFLTSVAHNLINGQVIRFTTTVTLPVPLVAGIDYTIINKTADTFQVAIIASGVYITTGTPIDITSAGAGVHSAAQVYAPDTRRYKVHKINLATAGNYTISTNVTAPQPTGDNNGKLFVLDIRNTTAAGAVVVTFGGLVIQVGYTNPAAGLRRSSWFYYSPLEGMVQIGAWSA